MRCITPACVGMPYYFLSFLNSSFKCIFHCSTCGTSSDIKVYTAAHPFRQCLLLPGCHEAQCTRMDSINRLGRSISWACEVQSEINWKSVVCVMISSSLLLQSQTAVLKVIRSEFHLVELLSKQEIIAWKLFEWICAIPYQAIFFSWVLLALHIHSTTLSTSSIHCMRTIVTPPVFLAASKILKLVSLSHVRYCVKMFALVIFVYINIDFCLL